MYNSKLIKIYQSLNKHERLKLKKWIKSPIHNSNKNATLLLDYLINKRTFTPKNTDRKKLFKILFPTEEYNDVKFRQVMTLCVDVLENFVAWIMQKRDPFLKKKNLLIFYSEREEEDLFKQRMKSTDAFLIKEKLNMNYFSYCYEIEKLKLGRINFSSTKKTTHFEAILTNTRNNYIVQVLKNSLWLINAKGHLEATPDVIDIISIIENNNLIEYEIIAYYYYAYMLYYQEKTDFLDKLYQLFFANASLLESNDATFIFSTLTNYLVKSIVKLWTEKKARMLLSLYKHGLESRILWPEGTPLNEKIYVNITSLAAELKDHLFIEEVLDKYTWHLKKENQILYKNFVEARLLFFKKKYNEALKINSLLGKGDFSFNLGVKIILIQIWYKKRDYILLLSFLKSFNLYLYRHKNDLGEMISRYQNTIKYTKKLVDLASHKKTNFDTVKKSIIACEALLIRQWLLEELELLEG